ncbi:MAG: hemolysin family protein [Caulobacter sp.]|nr:hemolysin family protein [Caulobacter sp.]
MAHSDDVSPPPETPRSRRGFWSLFGRVRNGLAGEPVAEMEPTTQAGETLAAQARAFQTLTVDDVMTPRADIVAVEYNTPFEGLVAQFSETEHSRLPVYRGTLDDPIGFVHIKDVFKLLASKGRRPAGVLKRLRRPAPGVPGSMRAATLLAQMQKTRVHMALVIDEYGGTEGLVTLEDLIEAVVGDIADEHDDAAVTGLRVLEGGIIEASARALLEDLEAVLGENQLGDGEHEEDIDTVGGLVIAIAGRVPRRGDVIRLTDAYDIEVIAADPRRVKRVRFRPRPVETGVEEAPAA